MNVPFVLKPQRMRRQPSLRNTRLLTAQSKRQLFRKYSASRQETLAPTSSSQLMLTSLRRASARSTERLIEDTQIRIIEVPKSCKSHLLNSQSKEDVKLITIQVPKSQRLLKTMPSEHKTQVKQSLKSMSKIYTKTCLDSYLIKYKKWKSQQGIYKLI